MIVHDTASDSQQDLRVLVADDNEINQKLAHLILQSAGYHVDIVEDGQQAVETYQHNHFDLILMDIQMPFMGGYEAAQRIRIFENEMRNETGNNPDRFSDSQIRPSAFKPVPIIAVTGDDPESVLGTCLQYGMNDCIGKPLQKDQLLSVVQAWTDAGPNLRPSESEVEKFGLAPRNTPNNESPLNLEKAIEEFLGKKDILLDALEAFINSVEEKIATIHRACFAKDFQVIAAAAHSIKGGAANLTANRLANFASDLEEAANWQLPEKVGGLVDKTEEQFRQLEQYCWQNSILLTSKEKKRKILIVEDEIISQTKLALILENFGKCDVTDNGEDAIDQVNGAWQNNDPYGLIMLDIDLPEKDGISILSSIRALEKSFKIQDGRETKILMTSSFRDKDRIIACVQSGCDGYIAKPFVAEVIKKKLAELGLEEYGAQV